jgi:hypothetical protein
MKLCLKKEDVGGLISRIFYGIDYTFSDWTPPIKYSEHAIEVARDRKLPLNEMEWEDRRYVKSGEEKVLHREHIFTGKMFKKNLQTLAKSRQLTPKKVVGFIKRNYCIAWIDMKDHDMVNKGPGKDGTGTAKSNRGKNLKEALDFFKKKGVNLRGTFPKQQKVVQKRSKTAF